MTDAVFELVTAYGAYVIFSSAFLSCLAVPIPTSLMMMAGGAFVASGDLALLEVVVAAYLGAIMGDQVGFRIGRLGGGKLHGWIERNPARMLAMGRARNVVDQHGGLGVFFSTWLIAPLGPWVNVIAGVTQMGVIRFTLWDILGEVVWVAGYVGLGYAFASHITTIATLIGNVVGFLAATAVAVALAIWLRGALHNAKQAIADRQQLETLPDLSQDHISDP